MSPVDQAGVFVYPNTNERGSAYIFPFPRYWQRPWTAKDWVVQPSSFSHTTAGMVFGKRDPAEINAVRTLRKTWYPSSIYPYSYLINLCIFTPAAFEPVCWYIVRKCRCRWDWCEYVILHTGRNQVRTRPLPGTFNHRPENVPAGEMASDSCSKIPPESWWITSRISKLRDYGGVSSDL